MTYAKPTIIRAATVAVLCLLACTIGTAGTALAVIVATCAYLPVRFIHHGKEGRKAAIFFHRADFVLGTAWLAGCAAALFYYLYCYIFLAPADKDGYRNGAPLLTVAAILITCTLLHGRDFMAKRWMERRLEVWRKRTFIDFNKADGNYYAIEQFGTTFLKYTLLASKKKFIINSYEIWLRPDSPAEEAKARSSKITAEVERLGVNVQCELQHTPDSVFANVSLTFDKRDISRLLLDNIARIFIEDAGNDYDRPYYIKVYRQRYHLPGGVQAEQVCTRNNGRRRQNRGDDRRRLLQRRRIGRVRVLARLLAAMGRRQVLRYRGRRLPNRIHPSANPLRAHRTALKYNKLTASRHKVCIFAALYGVFIAEQIIITHISK